MQLLLSLPMGMHSGMEGPHVLRIVVPLRDADGETGEVEVLFKALFKLPNTLGPPDVARLRRSERLWLGIAAQMGPGIRDRWTCAALPKSCQDPGCVLHTTPEAAMRPVESMSIPVDSGRMTLHGDLALPDGAAGIVAFAHGSGSSRGSPRNRRVAQTLNDGGLATLLFDLLTEDEEVIDTRTRRLRFDIPLLGRRLVAATDWLSSLSETKDLRVGYFGASTGAAAALIAAAERPARVAAVVSRGGRPDLAAEILPRVHAPTLLIVGGLDHAVIGMNQQALARLRCEKRLEIVPGATHLFEEAGTLDAVAKLALDWFQRHLGTPHVLAQ